MSYHFYPHSLLRRAVPLAACGLLTLLAPALAATGAGGARSHRPVADVPVSGRVTQVDGAPMPGVTVIVKGTALGTSTNAEGQFSLNVPEGSTLVISAVGFIRKEVTVAGATTGLEVRLDEDVQALSEVVVVGYGTQERGSVTGAVSSVSGEAVKAQPVADATQALQGRVAGVTVTSNGGAPGGASGTSVRIRGLTSAGNNAPLYVVDGFPLPSGDENQLNAISPNDIESIDVLKDASATAIYGLRAANGVVIITTKRGKAGKTNITFDAYRGVQQVWRRLDFLNAEEYAVINNENRLAKGDPVFAKLANPASLGTGTDWQDQIFRRAAMQNYAVSATGGTDKARYALSAGYFQQDGTIIGSRFERFTLRANGDVQIGKVLKIGNNLSLTHLNDRQVDAGGSEYGVISFASQIPATVQPYRADGSWYEPTSTADNFVEENPIAVALIDNKKFTRNRAITTFFAELEPLKGLRFRSNVGADLIFDNYNSFRPLVANSQRYTLAGAVANSTYAPSYLIENTLTYDHLFAGKHQVTLLAGQSAQQFDRSFVESARSGYLRNDLQNVNNGPVNEFRGASGYIAPPSRLASYFGRVNYEFGGKYLFQAIARYDGTYAFQPGRKFGFFPGVSAGWRVSEEGFLKDQRTVSNLKLRGGWGKVGNALNAGAFQYLYVINPGIQYPFGQDGAVNQGAAPTRLANRDLQWEENRQVNVGVDLGLLDNRFEASIDVYKRTSPNLIAPLTPSLVSGTYEQIATNAASAYNKGLDVALTSHNVRGEGDGLSWTTTLNFSTYKSRLESLGSGIPPYDGYGSRSGVIVRYNKGQSFGDYYGYVADGLFQTQADIDAHATQNSAAPGDIRFRDVNGDGTINADDRTYIGSPVPDFTYGVTNTLSWKGFDLNVFVQGSQGNDIYNLNRYYTEGALYGNGSGISRVLGRWTGPGTSNDVPRAIGGDPNQNLRVSTYFVEDGSYARLKLLTLGYTLPKAVMSRLYASQLRVYVSAQNLVTLTNYSGYDPEVGISGVDRGVYPQPRVLLAGVNIGF
ncbi:SusC/RagA family TonB-linked outer membrane protein [Hymenobacter edaphi]|uniref:SusC/RagA family TonB-linked outer membrane protein n=1 Tax=Hymenobacter edaphi TaxID=2211146 RepID=A0A328BQG6_9BACT|nr:TonB-dependent receptor [Hymenobacter edaphi]RAK69343.1 SusC/RagA family TonB-linked outer membrane protein [Hymenobacter edaphi]